VSRDPVDAVYLDIIVDVPAVGDRRFTYSCPSEISLPRGAKVRVPFGRARADGFVLGECAEKPPFSIKPVEDIYDLSFLPPQELLGLTEALARHYCASTASLWSNLYPPVVPRKSVARVLKEGGLPPHPAIPDREPAQEVEKTDLSKEMETVPVLYVWGSRRFRWNKYLDLTDSALRRGQSVLILCPETKVLEGILALLSARFPGEVCPVNSEMTGVVRRTSWLALSRGEVKIAAGTRSAVFAPLRDLGLVILDEEPGSAYKSLDWPFIDARTAAVARGTRGAKVVFGSAYPSVEAVENIERRRWSCLREGPAEPPENGEGLLEPGPRVTVVDLKETRPRREIISAPLQGKLAAAFSSGHRAVLFLNRRGDSSYVSCRDCGSAISCPRCGVPMSYHRREGKTICHTCGFREEAPAVCPACGGHNWRFSGLGIEKAEAEFQRKFPEVPVFTLDQDVARKTTPSEILGAFGRVSPGCLIATQLVLGQSLLPKVGMVGVLSADTALSVPDFRASERAYRLLAGLKDCVDPELGSRGVYVVQTQNPDHHAIRGVAGGGSFYEDELRMRRMLGYPPFKRFFRVKFEGRNLEKVSEAASAFVSMLPPEGDIRVLGPAPAPKPKVRGVYRWHVALKGDDHGTMAAECRRVLEGMSKFRAVKILVDVDPVDTE
jgi:primosomal protein N' (replication factor Y)